MDTLSSPTNATRDAFHAALGPRARRLCPEGQDVDGWIECAVQSGDWTVQTLAAEVGKEGRKANGLVLTTRRMKQRLRAAAGADDQRQQGDPE